MTEYRVSAGDFTDNASNQYIVLELRPADTDDEPWPPYPQPRPDHRWLLVLAVVVLLGLYRALRKENRE